MLVNDLGADRRMYCHGNAQFGAGEQHGSIATRQVFASAEICCQRFTRALPSLCPTSDRVVHLTTRLLRHAEGAVAEAGSHVFTGASVRGELEVVNGGAAVHRDPRDRTLPP